ncbi:hypothetical protein C4R89_10150 [Clostridioides difficile]|nr:hypothetical protein [Clostridioides difficile]
MQTGDYLNNKLGFYVIKDCKRKSELKYYPYLIYIKKTYKLNNSKDFYYLENKQVILYSTTYD